MKDQSWLQTLFSLFETVSMQRLLLGSLDPARLLVVGHGRSSRVVADGQALDHDEVILDEDGAELGEEGLEGESGGGSLDFAERK